MNNRSERAFARYGGEKMIYDARSGPQAVLHEGVLYVVYQANPTGPAAHPHIITCDLATRRWSEPVQIGDVDYYDHHFGPVLWFDPEDHLHVLYGCHNEHMPTHVVSREPNRIDAWQEAPPVRGSISYPRILHMADGRLLIYSRFLGHLGYWTYQISEDGGYHWSEPPRLVDFNDNPLSSLDNWACSYASVAPSTDRRSLHIAMVHLDERRTRNPRYNRTFATSRVAWVNRYNLYYLSLDLDSGRLYTIDGAEMDTPVSRDMANRCLVWDTDWRLTNIPAVLVDDDDTPSFVLPASGDAPWECTFYYVHRASGADTGGWERVPITATNNPWNGSMLRRADNGDLKAYLVTSPLYGELLVYGGGEIQEWTSSDGGATWRQTDELVPEEGLLYNNPRPVETDEGELLDDYVLFFGWEGPPGLQERQTGRVIQGGTGKAYLWHDGEWL